MGLKTDTVFLITARALCPSADQGRMRATLENELKSHLVEDTSFFKATGIEVQDVKVHSSYDHAKPLSPEKRPGFTLVEVALAVAVGLIVMGGAIVAFNAVRDNAAKQGYSSSGYTRSTTQSSETFRWRITTPKARYFTNSYEREDGVYIFRDEAGKHTEVPVATTTVEEQ